MGKKKKEREEEKMDRKMEGRTGTTAEISIWIRTALFSALPASLPSFFLSA